MQVKPMTLLTTLFVGFLIWNLPVPESLNENSIHLLAIFIMTIFGIVSRALPMGAMAILSLVITTLTGTLTIHEALSGFGSPIIWLIVSAYFVARSFVKTGLGMRIGYHFIGLIGHKTLGIAYGMGLTDLLLAPAIPSNTARCGGIIYPIIQSLSISYGSDPENKTERKIGSYLIQCAYQVNIITCAMFITAMAANPLIVSLAGKAGVEISWLSWFEAALLPGIIAFITIPYLVYKIYPPEIKETPDARQFSKEHLEKMGKIKLSEWITIKVFLLLLFLWTIGAMLWGIDSTTAALTGLAILVISQVLSWDDIKKEGEAWDTLIWFSTLITLARALNESGIINWMSDHFESHVTGLSWQMAYPLLILVYFYSHYFFASITAHVSAMYAPFLAVGIAVGIPPALIALSLAFCSSIYATLTHYGTGPGPLLFGAGYVSLSAWWRIGAIVGIVQLIIWMVIGPVWWKFLGLW